MVIYYYNFENYLKIQELALTDLNILRGAIAPPRHPTQFTLILITSILT